ncbi:MAG: hypothetical protein AB1894_23605 [Chloroflexota bacterium]
MGKKLALSEESDRWVIPLAGKTVTRVCLDFAFSLEFWEADKTFASIRIEGDFRFRQKDGIERVLSAEKDPTQLACALGIFQQQVESPDYGFTVKWISTDTATIERLPGECKDDSPDRRDIQRPGLHQAG